MHFELSIIHGKTVFDIIRPHRDECIVYEQAVAAGEDLRLANFFYEVVR